MLLLKLQRNLLLLLLSNWNCITKVFVLAVKTSSRDHCKMLGKVCKAQVRTTSEAQKLLVNNGEKGVICVTLIDILWHTLKKQFLNNTLRAFHVLVV